VERSKVDFDARIAEARGEPISGWTLHDFRRVASTTMHERLGVEPHIVEAILGHTNGEPVAKIYNQADYFDLRRAALEVWATFVLTLAIDEPPANNIIKLHA
jgi:integrase